MNFRNTRTPLWCAIFMVLSAYTLLPTQSNAQDVEIDTDSTEQVIRGFGAAFIEFWQPDLTADDVEVAFGVGEGQLGLSILRLGINPNPALWSENLVAARKASEMGALIFASPWNAPDELLKAKMNPGDADTVDVDKYDEYAGHLNDFNTYMEENGVDIHAISVQNEPDYAHDWTGWTAENMVAFLRDNAPSIDAKVMAPESFQFRKGFSDPILNDSLAAAHVDIVGGHIYGGGNSSYPLAEEMDKELWMTEYLLNLNTGNISTPWDEFTDEERWDETLQMLNTIHQSMKSNMSAYVWWYLKRYYSFLGDGQFREVEGEPTKRGYAFSQFSKFVRPGYVRLKSADPFGRGYLRVNATAYMDTTTSRIVIVAINGESSDRELSFVVDDMASASFSRYVTSIDQNVEQLDNIDVGGEKFSATLPGKSITTFVSDQVSVGHEEEHAFASGYRIDQNRPNPFGSHTLISYHVPVSSIVNLKVFDLLGREVATLVDGRIDAGEHRVRFDASGLSPGVYFYRLSADDVVLSGKMLLVR